VPCVLLRAVAEQVSMAHGCLRPMKAGYNAGPSVPEDG